MKHIGRKLRLFWGDGMVVEIVQFPHCKDQPPKEGELIDIYEAMGEKIEKKVGKPQGSTYGHSIDMILQNAVDGGSCWATEEEVAKTIRWEKEKTT